MAEIKMVRVVDSRGIARLIAEHIARDAKFMKKYGLRIQELPKQVAKEPVKPEPVAPAIPVVEVTEPVTEPVAETPAQFTTDAPDLLAQKTEAKPVTERKTPGRKPGVKAKTK